MMLGPLSLLGIGKKSKAAQPQQQQPAGLVAASGEYPVHRSSCGGGQFALGESFSLLENSSIPLKAMDEEDEDVPEREGKQDVRGDKFLSTTCVTTHEGGNHNAPSALIPAQLDSIQSVCKATTDIAATDYPTESDSCFPVTAGVGGGGGGSGLGLNVSLDTLRDMLKCVGCHRFLFPPILQCTAGHMACRTCFEAKNQCAKCRQKMVEVPAKFAEMITEQFKVLCAFAEKGCQETVPFKYRREHEEICPYKPVQCPEFDCTVKKPMNEIFKHFRLQHHHHFVNAHGSIFNGDIRCDDSNMVAGVERKWAPTMMKLDNGCGGGGGSDDELGHLSTGPSHFFLEILRTRQGVWHMWIWYLGEPEEAVRFRCEIAVRRKNRDEDTELKYSGRVHSIRIPPHRVILSGCLLSFSDCAAAHFRYLGDGHAGHPVIDYRVSVARSKKRSSSSERAMAAGLSKMLRRFSMGDGGGGGGGGKANKASTDY